MTDPLADITVSSDAYATTATTRYGSNRPIAYRLVKKDDGNGGTAYALQGYFTWTEGFSKRGGEWRDLETQDQTTAVDSIPFGPLL
jgi:hypothetical protein